MSRKKKGMNVARVALATTMATSVVAITNPADAASQKETEKLVLQAEKLATNLQKEITYETRVKLYPKDKLGLPNMKLYKDTEAALKKVKKEVNKLKGNSKKKLQTRLASKVEKPYTNATTYINVVNAAKKLDKTNKTLDQYLNEGKIDTSVIKLHTAFKENVKDFTQSISKVSGTETKQALRDTYVKKFNKTDKSASYAITIKNELAQLNKYVNAGEDEKAKDLQKTIETHLAQGEKLGYIKGILAKSYDASLTKVTADINKKYTYKAQSSDSANPTTYGGTTDKAKVINHDLVVVAGKNQYIKVTNVEVNGNVIIKGDETGAGTVTFDNVKVNSVNGKGGEIIVEDVADHSFYISNVKADKLSIKDINGGNIVAQEGTKIQELAVVDKAGETGKINLVSTKGSFEQVNVASTSGKTDVVLNGDFSQSKIEIKAPDVQVTLAKDVVIKAMDIKSEARINAQEGAKVETINLAVEQKNQKVELSGSLKDAKVNITNANVTVEVAKDTVIKEIAKDKDVTGDVAITNNGKIDTVTDVKVETPTPAPSPNPVVPPSSTASTPAPSPTPAAALTATAEPGTTANTTAVIATATTGHSLVYKVSSTAIATPNVGDSVTGTETLRPGADISGVDVTTHKYLGVYELDGSSKVVKFTLITLQASDIKVAESSVALNGEPTITTSQDGQKVTFSVELNYVNNYGTGTVTAEVGNKNGAGIGIGSHVVNDKTGTATITKELSIADLAQFKDENDKVYISIGIKDEGNNYYGTWKTIDTSSFEVPTIASAVSDIANLTIGVDDKGAITGDTATNGGALKYLLVDASKATQIDSWNVDTTEADANNALGGTLDATKPIITDADNTKLLVVAEIKDGKVVAAGQSSAIQVAPIDFYPNYSAGFTANENMLTINVHGNLTGPINTGKIKYMTSESGGKNLTLSGEYHKVDFNTDLKPGEYCYLSSGSDTIVYLKLTDNDANAIKGLEGYGNDSYTINENNDRLVAESGWYPNTVTGTKAISISNQISVTNNSTKEIASTHIFDKNDKEIGISGTSPGRKPGETFNILVNSQATKIVFYEGVYQPNVTPTNGKMKIIQVDENTLNGITLDDSNWINVNETNFGKSEESNQTAPAMDVTVEKGFALNTTSISYTPTSGNSLAVEVADSSVSSPTIGIGAPTGVVKYESGDDIANVSSGKFVQIYELDANNKVVKFQQVQLKSEQIQSESDFRFVLESNSFDSIAIEFNKALEESVYSKTNVDDVIKLFQVTNEDTANSFNKSNIKNIEWDTTNPSQPKLIINFNSNVTLSENYVMELGFVENAVPLDGDIYAYEVNEISGENLTPLIIKHIKQIAGPVEDSNLVNLVSDWLESLSNEGKIQNYDSNRSDNYQKEIAENSVTDLASLQKVIDDANKIELIDGITSAQDLVAHATVGSEPLVLQEDVDALSSAIVTAQEVVDNAEATLTEVETALTALQDAVTTYKDTVKDVNLVVTSMNITNDTLDFTVKVNEDATVFYVLVPKNEEIPSLEQVRQGNNALNNPAFKSGCVSLSANTEQIAIISGLAVGTPYHLVMFVEDKNGNTSDMNVITTNVLAPAPTVSADDVNNVLVGATDGMEYSIDGEQTWIAYDSTNVPTFEGNHTVSIRFAEGSAVTNIGFTTNAPSLKLIAFKGDYNLNEPFDYDFLRFRNANDEVIQINKEDIQIHGFDSSHYQANQEVTITVNGITETLPVNILPVGPAKLIEDDTLDTIMGLDNTMEFRIQDTENWIKYDGNNLPDLSGDKTIWVRYAETPEQIYSQDEALLFTNDQFILNSNEKNGSATNTLTYGWRVSPLNDVTFTSLQSKQMSDLFDAGQDFLNVLGDKDIQITGVTWDNSGEQLKSTFTLAEPINMKETLGVSFRIKNMDELDNRVGSIYLALYKANDSELLDLLLKEVSSHEPNSMDNIKWILYYMGTEEFYGVPKEKLINNYVSSFYERYVQELELSGPNIKSISNLQDLINKVNQEQFVSEKPFIQEEVNNMNELLAFGLEHKTEMNQETLDSFTALVPDIQTLFADFDPADGTKTLDQLTKTFIQLTEKLSQSSGLKWSLVNDLKEIDAVKQIQQELDNFYVVDMYGSRNLKTDVTQEMVTNVENEVNALPKDLQEACDFNNAIMNIKELLALQGVN